jgi:phage-related protein
MGFTSSQFIFDGIPGENFGLLLHTPDGGESLTAGSSDVEIYTQNVYRRAVPFFYGVQQTPVLSFDIHLYSEKELDTYEVGAIQRWLFGKNEYKRLQILQFDMTDCFYNCFLTNPQILRVGNRIVGFQTTVQADAPWAWTFDRQVAYDYGAGPITTDFVFNNRSDDGYYLFPTIVATMGISGGTLHLINHTENNREFKFTGLTANEVITIDCDRQIIQSSTGLRRLENFNKKWLRFLPGLNEIRVEKSNVKRLVIMYRFARKIGG